MRLLLSTSVSCLAALVHNLLLNAARVRLGNMRNIARKGLGSVRRQGYDQT